MAVITTSLGLEVKGGLTRVLFQRGTNLPARTVEVLTAGAGNQTSMVLHLLAGDAPWASDNQSIGKCKLADLSAAKTGATQIEVVFDVAADGTINLSARDLASDRVHSLTLISTFGLPITRLAIEADDLTVDDLTVDDTAAGDVAAEQDGGLNQRGDDVYAMVACSREQVKSRATIQFEHPDGRRIQIRIPLGAETGDQLRVRNKGAPSELLGGEPGDLFLGLTLIETDR